jgi:hypothetical protein
VAVQTEGAGVEAKGASMAQMRTEFGPFREIHPLAEGPNIRRARGSGRSLAAAVRNSQVVVSRTCDRIARRWKPSCRNSCSKPPRNVLARSECRLRHRNGVVARLGGVPDAGILFQVRPTCPTQRWRYFGRHVPVAFACMVRCKKC